MVDGPLGDNEKIVVASQQNLPPLIGLADRLTRSLGDKHPFEDLIPGSRGSSRKRSWDPSNNLLFCVNLVTCRSRPYNERLVSAIMPTSEKTMS